MINTILIIIILYLLWVIFYLGKDRLWCCKKEVGQVREQPIRKPKKRLYYGCDKNSDKPNGAN